MLDIIGLLALGAGIYWVVKNPDKVKELIAAVKAVFNKPSGGTGTGS